MDDGSGGVYRCAEAVHPRATQWKEDLERDGNFECTFPVPDRKVTPTRCGWTCDYLYETWCCPKAEGISRSGIGGAPLCTP